MTAEGQAHGHDGKSTLTNSILVAGKIVSQEVAGDVHATDNPADAAEHNTTIKSTGFSLLYGMTDESLRTYKGESAGNDYLINLIDTPGHLEFSSEVMAALRITDGVLVVVDCVEGVCAQTETVLRQALCEKIRPVLTVSKIDKLFLDPKVTGEQIYQIFSQIINKTNATIARYKDSFGDVQVHPDKGSVAFSACLHGWGFTLKCFAKMYASKFKVDESKMLKRLWGENFFDSATQKWSTRHTGTTTCQRGFVMLCYEAIKKVIVACTKDKEELWPILNKVSVNVTMKNQEELMGEALMKHVMQTWLPANHALLEMIVFHLPSPSEAQKYRVENLYKGPQNDKYATAIRNCDPEGPLMVYISKMIPASDKGRFSAFGRVFSGKVSCGMRVRIMGPSYVSGREEDLFVKSVKETAIWMGKVHESIGDIPCGNTVAMVGLDKFITKSATITNENEVDACPFQAMKFSVFPLVRVAVHCVKSSHLPKLKEGLKYLEKSDPLVICTNNEGSDQCSIAGAGKVHLQACLRDLLDFMAAAKIIILPYGSVFRETVVGEYSRTVMCTFANKRNRLYIKARPLPEELLEAVDRCDTPEVRSKILSDDFGWDNDVVNNIWCFGPETTGPNMVVDQCRGVSNQIKDFIVTGFQLASEKGALAEENMRGICFEICNIILNEDATRRGSSDEIIEAVKRAAHAAQLAAKPRLLQPVYLVEIKATEDVRNATKAALYASRGNIFEDVKICVSNPDNPLYNIKAYLAVQDSFEFLSTIEEATSNRAIPSQLVFDHWEIMNHDPLKAGSLAASDVTDIRRSKGLSLQFPTLSMLEDEL